MPLARYALYAQGVEIYVAPTYDSGERCTGRRCSTSRARAAAGCVGCGCAFQGRDLPDGLPGEGELFRDADAWINAGDSVIVAPGGKIVAGPLHESAAFCMPRSTSSVSASPGAAWTSAGHYARPDLFQLQVNDRPQPPVTFTTSSDRHG